MASDRRGTKRTLGSSGKRGRGSLSISPNAHWKEPLPQQISHKDRIFIPLVSESVAARDHGSVIIR
ncbi:MAG: hypothetical protein OEZ30_08090 [Candidatus Aminicenantes bacterium]|nr:hypothetical protein [Candidatus Aminicenantes bacterium]